MTRMKRRMRPVSVLALVMVLATAVGVGTGSAAKPGHQPLVVGYFIQWGIYGRASASRTWTHRRGREADRTSTTRSATSRRTRPATSSASRATPGPTTSGRSTAEQSVDGVADAAGQPLARQLRPAAASSRRKHPDLKVLISLGGWTWSKYFSDAALTPESRQTLVSLLHRPVHQGQPARARLGDAGGPARRPVSSTASTSTGSGPAREGNAGNVIRPEDKQNFTAAARRVPQAARRVRTQAGKHYQLTAFLPAAPAKIDAGFEAGRSSTTSTSAPCRATTSTAPGSQQTNHQANLFTSPSRTRPSRSSRSTGRPAPTSSAARRAASSSSACRSTRVAGPACRFGRRRAVPIVRRPGARRTGRPASTTTRS